PLAVREHPGVGRRRLHHAAIARDVPRRQPRPAVAVALLERGRELDLDQRLAPEAPDLRRLEAAVGQDLRPRALELQEHADAPGSEELLRRREAVNTFLG